MTFEKENLTEKSDSRVKESKFWHYVGFGGVYLFGLIFSDALNLSVFIKYLLVSFLVFNFLWFMAKNKEKDIRGYKWLAGKIRSRFVIWLIYVVSMCILVLLLTYIFLFFMDWAEIYGPDFVNHTFGFPVLLFVFFAALYGLVYLAEKIFSRKKIS